MELAYIQSWIEDKQGRVIEKIYLIFGEKVPLKLGIHQAI